MPAPLREFLGWDRPCLPRAAEWLLSRYGSPRAADLSAVTVVLPGRRAGRRLIELIAESATGLPFSPPRIVTPGELPERLYDPSQPVADELTVELAWTDALRSAPAHELEGILRSPPEADDLLGWILLARQLAELRRTLAGDCVELADVPAKFPALLDVEAGRWESIARIHRRALDRLARMGRVEPDAARLQAVATQSCRAEADMVLVAASDLNKVNRAMLAQVTDRVVALVHAPVDRADDFDELGCVIPARWADRPLDLNPMHIRVVDRPIDQACEVLAALSRPDDETDGPSLAERFTASQITVGLGDDRSASLIERTLELAGVSARAPWLGPVNRSAPALLLSSLASFLDSRRFDDLAALLRHPDLADHLRASLPIAVPDSESAADAVDDWITLLDRYASDHLQRRLASQWLGKTARAARLKAVHDATLALAPIDHARAKPLPHWSAAIAAVLTRINPARFDPASNDDQPTIAALEAIGQRLRLQAELDDQSPLTPSVTFAQAVALTLDGLSDAMIPQEPGHASVELLSWLELQLDDAPVLLITSVNERCIPASFSGDAFLPQSLRSALGMEDNLRRFARDRMMLEAILRSRPHVRLIAGRRGAEDEPLAPSRLLLACPEDELPARLSDFYEPRADAPGPALLMRPASVGNILVPRPVPLSTRIDTLSVTAFRDYLACPYRFYLRHVLRLRPLDDRDVELTPMTFGNLAHHALEALAQDPLAASTDPREIARFLSHQLDRLLARDFGDGAPAVVWIQGEQLRTRLDAFAEWHARQVTEGWRIRARQGEIELRATRIVDDEPFHIKGRIDRIDQHAQLGLRVMDYKTSDGGDKPDKTHRRAGKWVELQLPLYDLLARSAGCEGAIELGYILLPKKTGDTGFVAATWNGDEIAEAMAVADGVIRAVRQGVFWPPRYPVDRFDEFARICMDQALDRAAVLGSSGGGP